MGHNVLTLLHDRFEARCVLGKTLLNVGGETYEVVVERCGLNIRSPSFKAICKETKKVLAEFNCWHMEDGPDMYQIRGISCKGVGDGTLIVFPTLQNWMDEFNPPDEED